MSQWNTNEQWGGQAGSQGYHPMYEPGPQSQPYATQYAPPQGPPQGYGAGYSADQKNPYAGERFKPKKRVNDIFFLILYILTVGEVAVSIQGDVLMLCLSVSRVRCTIWHSTR
jgi:hypothetical protein